MIFPVPTSPPINLVADMIGSRFVILSWQPPAIPNGVITSYTVTYNQTGETSLVVQTGEQYTIPGLNPYSYYQFTVFASTSLGDGPPTLPITLRTAVASE
jgi:netrin-G3 ligand